MAIRNTKVDPREAETPQEVPVDTERNRTERVTADVFGDLDKRRAVGQTPVRDYPSFAADKRDVPKAKTPREVHEARKNGESGLREDDDSARSGERESTRTLTLKGGGYEGLKWTGRNIAQMVEFCGPDPLGNDAATWSRQWDGVMDLHIHDGSWEDGESLGTTHDVKVGDTVVRSERRKDGGYRRLFPYSDDRLNRDFEN